MRGINGLRINSQLYLVKGVDHYPKGKGCSQELVYDLSILILTRLGDHDMKCGKLYFVKQFVLQDKQKLNLETVHVTFWSFRCKWNRWYTS